jgi:hypothetical protein
MAQESTQGDEEVRITPRMPSQEPEEAVRETQNGDVQGSLLHQFQSNQASTEQIPLDKIPK